MVGAVSAGKFYENSPFEWPILFREKKNNKSQQIKTWKAALYKWLGIWNAGSFAFAALYSS